MTDVLTFKMPMIILVSPLMDPVFQQPSNPHSSSWQHCNHNLYRHLVTPKNSNNHIHVSERHQIQRNLLANTCGAGVCVQYNLKMSI
jgi:hypothetical protein